MIVARAGIDWLRRAGTGRDSPARAGSRRRLGADVRCARLLHDGVDIRPRTRMAKRGQRAHGVLRDGTRGTSSGGLGARRVLIAAEVALSVVLLVGAGLLVRSFIHLRAVDPGIDPAGSLSFKISLPPLKYEDEAKAADFFSEVVDPAAAASWRAGEPVRPTGWRSKVSVDRRSLCRRAPGRRGGGGLRHKAITPGYFARCRHLASTGS